MTPAQFKRRREELFPAISQRQSRIAAAAAMGVSPATIENWEYGRRQVPESAVTHLEDIAKLQECIEALEDAYAALEAEQGEWAGVNEPYAPEWTHSLKEASSAVAAVIAKAKI